MSTQTLEFGAQGVDVLHVYERAVQALGRHHAFVLESRQGPAQDCRQSVVGVQRLASVELTLHGVTIDAAPDLKSWLGGVVDRALGGGRMFRGHAPFDAPQDAWPVLRALASAFELENPHGAFQFGYLSCWGYDAAHLIEHIERQIHGNEIPLVTLNLFQHYFVVPSEGPGKLLINRSKYFPAADSSLLLSWAAPGAEPSAPVKVPPAQTRFTMERDTYLGICDIALQHIRKGNIYQVQLGHEIEVGTDLKPVELYRRLRLLNPSPYMFLCHGADHDLVGASPESYIRVEGGVVSMRPIAGTIGKSAMRDDAAAASELASSAKENAEHIMLVDLCRNDIGKVCEPHSLDVPSLMVVEEFPNLFHLVSTVSGRLRADCDVFDVIRASFPAGTMVGAPKIRAMQIIEDLEVSRRGHYAGAVGLIGVDGSANLALCIRMATHQAGRYRIRASAGVVVDSRPESEWRETLVKMGAMYRALTAQELDA